MSALFHPAPLSDRPAGQHNSSCHWNAAHTPLLSSYHSLIDRLRDGRGCTHLTSEAAHTPECPSRAEGRGWVWALMYDCGKVAQLLAERGIRGEPAGPALLITGNKVCMQYYIKWCRADINVKWTEIGKAGPLHKALKEIVQNYTIFPTPNSPKVMTSLVTKVSFFSLDTNTWH